MSSKGLFMLFQHVQRANDFILTVFLALYFGNLFHLNAAARTNKFDIDLNTFNFISNLNITLQDCPKNLTYLNYYEVPGGPANFEGSIFDDLNGKLSCSLAWNAVQDSGIVASTGFRVELINLATGLIDACKIIKYEKGKASKETRFNVSFAGVRNTTYQAKVYSLPMSKSESHVFGYFHVGTAIEKQYHYPENWISSLFWKFNPNGKLVDLKFLMPGMFTGYAAKAEVYDVSMVNKNGEKVPCYEPSKDQPLCKGREEGDIAHLPEAFKNCRGRFSLEIKFNNPVVIDMCTETGSCFVKTAFYNSTTDNAKNGCGLLKEHIPEPFTHVIGENGGDNKNYPDQTIIIIALSVCAAVGLFVLSILIVKRIKGNWNGYEVVIITSRDLITDQKYLQGCMIELLKKIYPLFVIKLPHKFDAADKAIIKKCNRILVLRLNDDVDELFKSIPVPPQDFKHKSVVVSFEFVNEPRLDVQEIFVYPYDKDKILSINRRRRVDRRFLEKQLSRIEDFLSYIIALKNGQISYVSHCQYANIDNELMLSVESIAQELNTSDEDTSYDNPIQDNLDDIVV